LRRVRPRLRSRRPPRRRLREVELAGAGAIGLLVLIGGAFAFSRRRREEDESAPATITATPALAEPIAYETISATPVMVSTTAADSAAIAGAPTTALHDDFDLSRYGAHVQAAYRGPTEDNPSLSLRHRLKRARFMDQRARETGDYAIDSAPATGQPRKAVAQTVIGTRLKEGLRAFRAQGVMRPAFG
jgi:hypothetical protein